MSHFTEELLFFYIIVSHTKITTGKTCRNFMGIPSTSCSYPLGNYMKVQNLEIRALNLMRW